MTDATKETNKSQNDSQNDSLPDLLTAAGTAVQEGRWEEARSAYQRAATLAPDNANVQSSLASLSRLEAVDVSIQELIERGDTAYENREYKQALEAYSTALNLAGENHIRRYHNTLEPKQDEARELYAWQSRIEERLGQMQKHKDKGNLENALKASRALLQELPAGERYEMLAAPLREAQQSIEGLMDDEALFARAQEAYRSKDYEECVRLAALVSDRSPNYENAQLLLLKTQDFLNKYIRPHLRSAREAFERKEWADAFAHLERLRTSYPDSPVWQQLWLQVGMAHGQQELEAGRKANFDGHFEQAQRHFEAARVAFDMVVSEYQGHMTAPGFRDEAAELTQIAAIEAQAEGRWHQGRRDEALAALDTVLRRIERARSEGREYATVAAVVATMHAVVERELQRIEGDRIRLEEGERLLESKELDRAAECFRQTLTALLNEHQDQASDGLTRTDALQRTFAAKMKEGREAPDPEAAVAAFQAARELWPSGPDLLQQLEAALVRAGQAAQDAEREKDAAGYFNQALSLNPDNRTAQLTIRYMEDGPKIEAALDEIQHGLETIVRRGEGGVARLQELEERLEKLQSQARPYVDLKARVSDLLKSTTQLRKKWQSFEQGRIRAEKAQQDGHWVEAVDLLGSALLQLGEAPPALAEQLGAWRQVADETEKADSAIVEALARAKDSYERAADSGNFDEPLRALTEAEGAIERLSTLATAARGPVPPSVANRRDKVEDLKRRVEIARDAHADRSATDALLIVQKALQKWPGDSTFLALERALTERAREEVDQLVRHASSLIRDGQLTDAEDELRRAWQLRPEDQAIGDQYAAVQRRRKLEARLRQVENDADDKLQGRSIVEARGVTKRGLQIFLEPDIDDLPAEAQSLVEALLRLAENADGLAFGLPAYWPQAQEICEQLGRLGSTSWTALRASQIADAFANITRDHALAGVIASGTILNNHVDAHRAARDYLSRHPNDEEAVRYLATTQEDLVNQIKESVSKRLERARAAKERGEYDLALENLLDLAGFYTPVDQEFSNLLDGYPEVESIRQDASDMKHELETLKSAYASVFPRLEEAEKAFGRSRLDEAEKLLAELSNLDAFPALQTRALGLAARIASARTEDRIRELHRGMHLAKTSLRQAENIDAVKKIEEDLVQLGENLQVPSLPLEEREQYNQIHDQVRAQIEAVDFGTAREARADEYLEEGDYRNAAIALQEALQAARDPRTRAALKDRLALISARVEEQRVREDTFRKGRDQFRAGNYLEAKEALEKAGDAGADPNVVARLVLLCRVGIICNTAEELAKQADKQQDTRRREELLEEALEQLELAPEVQADSNDSDSITRMEGELITRRVKSLKARLERRLRRLVEDRQNAAKAAEQREQEKLNLQREVRMLIGEAQVSLLADDLESARRKIDESLGASPDQPEALALQQEILRAIQAQQMLEQARKAMELGDYDKALAQVKAILVTVQPNHPAATALKEQIEAGRRANEALTRAEALAHEAEFHQARQLLKEAISLGAARDLVRSVQDKVGELEQKWESETIDPIRKGMLDGDFENAHGLSKQALGRVASPEFRLRLENQHAEVVTRWVQHDLDKLRGGLLPDADKAELETVAVKLERLASLDPPAHLAQEIAALRNTVNSERLKQMLVAVQRLADKAAWDEAFEQLKQIQIEADGLALGPVAEQAMNLELELNTRRTHEVRSAYQATHDQLMAEAQQAWQNKKRRTDLERAGELAEKALQVRGFERDREAAALHRQALDEIAILDDTESAIRASREHVRQRKFREAEGVLRLNVISPLLKAEYDRQHGLARVLHQADQDQDRSAWEAALNGFRRAIEQDSTLEPLLDEYLARCRKWLMEDVLLRARTALLAVPPLPGEARAILENAKAQGWITAALQVDVDRLLGWSNSLEHVAEAAEVLKQDGGDLKQALAALRSARRHLPAGQDDAVIRHWELLAAALSAWPEDLEEVARCLDALEKTPLNELNRVRQLRRDMTHKQEKERVRREEDQRRVRLFEQANDRVEAALSAVPPRCEDALAAVQQASRQMGDDRRLADLVETVRRRLNDLVEAARIREQYDEAIRLAMLLATQDAKDDRYRNLPEVLTAERRQKMDETLAQAQGHIRAFRPDFAEQALLRAAALAEPEDERLIATVRREVDSRRDLMATVHHCLDQVREAASAGNWEEVLVHLQPARQQAADYGPVQKSAAQVQEQLQAAAEAALASDQFMPALNLCALGLRLGHNGALEGLQRNIASQREARLAVLQQQGQDALAVWDLDAANSILAQSEGLADSDSAFQFLREQARQIGQRADDVKRQMQAGWSALRGRDYPAACRAFDAALQAAPSFREAQTWHDFASIMNQAIDLVANDRWDAFYDVARLLREADSRLVLKTTVRLPVLLPNLVDERRRALWNVRQLLPVADQIATLHERYEAHVAQDKVDRAFDLMPQIEQQCETFLRRHGSPSAPPADFSGREVLPPPDRSAPADDTRRSPQSPAPAVPATRAAEPGVSDSPARMPRAEQEQAPHVTVKPASRPPRAKPVETPADGAIEPTEAREEDRTRAAKPSPWPGQPEPQPTKPQPAEPPGGESKAEPAQAPPVAETAEQAQEEVPLPDWDFAGPLPEYDN